MPTARPARLRCQFTAHSTRQRCRHTATIAGDRCWQHDYNLADVVLALRRGELWRLWREGAA